MKIALAWPVASRKAIVPIFLPFMGCKVRCVFCAQDRQTGAGHMRGLDELRENLQKAQKNLADFRQRHGESAELAFYGGTFTALPENIWNVCLEFIEKCRSSGLISSFRCSTRPDALAAPRLEVLRKLGCKTVELGIQSFDDEALSLSGRDYTEKEALEACATLKREGFLLGVQLLPGMPGVSPEIFIRDVAKACQMNADLLRFYPCLVLKGTGLAKLWQEGKFRVWNLAETMGPLARAWNMAREARIAVSRIGLAQEKDLDENILAGPCHPSLGSRIQGLALFLAIKEKLETIAYGRQLAWINLPERAQGFFWGWNGELKAGWSELGLGRDKVFYWKKDHIEAEIRI